MRMTREELKEKWFTSWNDSLHDIVAVNYGDEPLFRYDQEEYEKFQKLTGTLANIEAVDAYIYSRNGNYDEYRTLVGTVKIAEDGRVLCGDINVKYRGKIHNIIVNRMYGFYAAVNENVRTVLSCSIEQAVHDFVSSYLHNNPERKIEILNAEIV